MLLLAAAASPETTPCPSRWPGCTSANSWQAPSPFLSRPSSLLCHFILSSFLLISLSTSLSPSLSSSSSFLPHIVLLPSLGVSLQTAHVCVLGNAVRAHEASADNHPHRLHLTLRLRLQIRSHPFTRSHLHQFLLSADILSDR